MNDVSPFYNRVKIQMADMEDAYVKGRSCKASLVSNLHHYQIDLFYVVIDIQLQKLNNCFNEVNTELPLCVTLLSPRNTFNGLIKKSY